MKDVNLRVDLNYNNELIEIRHTDIFIGSHKISLYKSAHTFLSNKQLVSTLYEKCIKEIESLPKTSQRS
jgi:hypothetical protein